MFKKYVAFLAEIQKTNNPASMGTPKTGRYKNYFGHRPTKPVRVIYAVSYEDRTISTINVGDHKELYMRDNRP